MIAAWMLYCALWTAWACAVAWVIERVVLRGRAALRGVWIGAMAVSIGGPVVGYAFSHWPTQKTATVDGGVEVMRATGSAPHHNVVSAKPSTIERATIDLQRVVARSDRPLAALWTLLSLAVLVYVSGGLVHLHFLRRAWRCGVVNGVDVMISDDTGPALVGVFRTTIVIPEWALHLEPRALSLLMQHELEHRRAGDARLLALAQVAVAAAPWNPMLWWQLRRLRLAVELDCDARVLGATPDIRSYGRLLLEVGRPRRDIRFAGAALADHATHLEQRILAMTRRRRGATKHVVLGSVVAGALAVVIGCQMPVPVRSVPSVSRPRSSATAMARDSAIVKRDTSVHVLNRRYGRVDFNQDIGSVPAKRDSASVKSRPERRDSLELKAAQPAQQQTFALSDSVDAEQSSPGCSASSSSPADSVVVRLLVSKADVARGGKTAVYAAPRQGGGTTLGNMSDGMLCSARVSGLLRLYGAGAIVNRELVVTWGVPTVVVVKDGAGHVLAGPVVLSPATRAFEMSWAGR